MANKKVCNEQTKVPATIEMNDKNYLTDMLETEKNMSVNMTIALNEASNETLFKELFTMFLEIKESQRTLYELAFEKGWYTLEEAEQTKVSEKAKMLAKELEEFQN